jgi:hypothetical protein
LTCAPDQRHTQWCYSESFKPTAYMPHFASQQEISRVSIQRAFYIKLGKGGAWELNSLATHIMRIGWPNNALADVNAHRWEVIEHKLRAELSHKGTATRDVNALREIVLSSEADVWITFHGSRLWWCRLAEGPVEEDQISKFRRLRGKWSDRDIHGRVLLIADIPGTLSQLQGFRGTVCAVKAADRLERLLNGESSLPHQAVSGARDKLVREVQSAIGELHWKDFETLVDLIFRQAGWRRLSVLGETMKYADLELEEPITAERYQVQIKSAADTADFVRYRDEFKGRGFRKLFFVVHSPTSTLANAESSSTVELVLPARLSAMVVDAGLVSWILAKIR